MGRAQQVTQRAKRWLGNDLGITGMHHGSVRSESQYIACERMKTQANCELASLQLVGATSAANQCTRKELVAGQRAP